VYLLEHYVKLAFIDIWFCWPRKSTKTNALRVNGFRSSNKQNVHCVKCSDNMFDDFWLFIVPLAITILWWRSQFVLLVFTGSEGQYEPCSFSDFHDLDFSSLIGDKKLVCGWPLKWKCCAWLLYLILCVVFYTDESLVCFENGQDYSKALLFIIVHLVDRKIQRTAEFHVNWKSFGEIANTRYEK